MFSTARLIPALCVCSGLMAQAMSDLNSLVIQSSRYIAKQTEGQPVHPDLNLFRIIGASGGAETLMHAGTDVQMWTLIYQIDPAGAPVPPMKDQAFQSLSVQCNYGLFNAMLGSPLPVFDAKSLQWAWFAVSLDEAIDELKGLGFTRGFANVTVMRPMHPRYPDECTFIFKCPPRQGLRGDLRPDREEVVDGALSVLSYQMAGRESAGVFMGVPAPQPKAWMNSGRSAKGAFTRNLGGAWGSTRTHMRTISSRAWNSQAWA